MNDIIRKLLENYLVRNNNDQFMLITGTENDKVYILVLGERGSNVLSYPELFQIIKDHKDKNKYLYNELFNKNVEYMI